MEHWSCRDKWKRCDVGAGGALEEELAAPIQIGPDNSYQLIIGIHRTGEIGYGL